MKSGFIYLTHLIFRYRLSLVMICVILLHALTIFHSLSILKNNGNDLTPQNVISATMIKSLDAKTLSSVNHASRELAPEHVPEAKFVETDFSIKKKQSRRNHNTVSKKISKPTHETQSVGTKPEALADGNSETQNLSPAPIHIENPSFKSKRPVPIYPQQALRLRQDGVVVIRVLISKNGHVTQARVHKSSGSEWLDLAAVKAALMAQFYPYLVAGVPHHAQADLPFKFVMK